MLLRHVTIIFLIKGNTQFHLEVSKNKVLLFSHPSSQTLWRCVDLDEKPLGGLLSLLRLLSLRCSSGACVDNVVHTCHHASTSEEAEPNSEPCLNGVELRKSAWGVLRLAVCLIRTPCPPLQEDRSSGFSPCKCPSSPSPFLMVMDTVLGSPVPAIVAHWCGTLWWPIWNELLPHAIHHGSLCSSPLSLMLSPQLGLLPHRIFSHHWTKEWVNSRSSTWSTTSLANLF